MTIADKIKGAVLAGRRIVQKSKPAAAPLGTDEARERLSRFAALLKELGNSRRDMDNLSKLAADAKGQDLAELLLQGKELPDVAGLASQAEAARRRTAATRQALDQLATGAIEGFTVLRAHKQRILQRIESEVMKGIERPSWMSDADFEAMLPRVDCVAKIAALREIPVPNFNMRRHGDKLALGHYRTEPMPTDPFGLEEDQLEPNRLSGEINAWLEHLQKLETLKASDLQ